MLDMTLAASRRQKLKWSGDPHVPLSEVGRSAAGAKFTTLKIF